VRSFQLALVGAGGEPVDFRRTLASHGVAALPPNDVDEQSWALSTTIAVDGGPPPTVRMTEGRSGFARVQVQGKPLEAPERKRLRAMLRHMLCLDEDFSAFYEQVASDPDLAWAAAGAGRMLRSPTVFEDVVKTICTTNCAWSATERMVGALVEHLGRRGPHGRAFPTPEAMAGADEGFYREVVRAGYRGAYLRALAASVAAGEVGLEELARDHELPDEEVDRRLRELPGVGPYAAAQIMVLIGRYSRLILDSWSRPKYARLAGKKAVADRTIERRFRRYGRYAGLAFWLFVTRDWIDEQMVVQPA
jgi:3-methyladenine DNA glycosylase/8-oxoguanine DNA glycosylase